MLPLEDQGNIVLVHPIDTAETLWTQLGEDELTGFGARFLQDVYHVSFVVELQFPDCFQFQMLNYPVESHLAALGTVSVEVELAVREQQPGLPLGQEDVQSSILCAELRLIELRPIDSGGHGWPLVFEEYVLAVLSQGHHQFNEQEQC